MIHDIAVAVLGGTTAVSVLYGLYVTIHASKLKDALQAADRLAKQCMDSKDAAEQGFGDAKKFFDEQMKRPYVVSISEEQIRSIAESLGGVLLPYVRVGEMVKQ